MTNEERISILIEMEHIKENFISRFLKETGLKPSEYVLVQQLTDDGFRFWLEKK